MVVSPPILVGAEQCIHWYGVNGFGLNFNKALSFISKKKKNSGFNIKNIYNCKLNVKLMSNIIIFSFIL